MKIVFLNGGLANQVFQYIYYRYGQIMCPRDDWYLDDSFFFVHKVHNGYELERVFGVRPNLLSGYFDPEVWRYMMDLKSDQGKSIPQILLENGSDIKMVAEKANWKDWNPFTGETDLLYKKDSYGSEITGFHGDIYYHGYWIIKDWFKAIEKQIRSELIFSEIEEDDEENLRYIDEIRNSKSCSMHIRRGDFVDLGISISDEMCFKQVSTVLQSVPDITLFVFSDDLEYCKSHAHDMGLDLSKRTVFVEGNGKEKAFRDLQLMSECEFMINGNSSFCYLAALLNQNLHGIVNLSNYTV